jgi:MOSC domain-containing protein YiiM
MQIGATAVIRITGLRNPCSQLDRFQHGLTAAVLDRDAKGGLVRKAGVMAVVLQSGDVHPGDAVVVDLPEPPYLPLAPV